jgi:hypothetical protein
MGQFSERLHNGNSRLGIQAQRIAGYCQVKLKPGIVGPFGFGFPVQDQGFWKSVHAGQSHGPVKTDIPGRCIRCLTCPVQIAPMPFQGSPMPIAAMARFNSTPRGRGFDRSNRLRRGAPRHSFPVACCGGQVQHGTRMV